MRLVNWSQCRGTWNFLGSLLLVLGVIVDTGGMVAFWRVHSVLLVASCGRGVSSLTTSDGGFLALECSDGVSGGYLDG